MDVNHKDESLSCDEGIHVKNEYNEFNNEKPSTNGDSTAGCDLLQGILGDFGIWQLRTILIIYLCKIPASWFMACIIFTAPELYPATEFICDNSSLSGNQSITADQCFIEDVGSAEYRRCDRFVYNFPSFHSLIMEFDLVCWRDIFVAWTQYWHLFGVLVGGVTATQLMQFLSPRQVYLIGEIAQIVCGVVTGYARDFSLHCAFRCLSAVCCAIMFTAGQAIFTDITGGLYRIGAIIIYDTFWSIGVILLPTLSSFFHSWTHIYLGITFPTILLIILLKWTPDSPRWLLKNGNKKQVDYVENMIRTGAEINQRTFKIPIDFHEQLISYREKLQASPPLANWIELWQGSRAIIHMIAAHLALSVFVINFMGMLLNIRSFGRAYLVPNTIAMGFSEIVGCFLALHFTLKHNKWKWQWAGGFNIIAGLFGFLSWILSPMQIDAELKVMLWMILATISKMAVSCAQSMILACMSESMPVEKKAKFVFSVVTFARVWLLSAPFINVLKKIDVALSLSTYCLLSVFGGVCTCLIITPRPTITVLTSQYRNRNATKRDEVSPLNVGVWTIDSNLDNTRF